MTTRIFGATGLIGGAAGDLDAITIAGYSPANGDKALVLRENKNPLAFTFDATATDAETVTSKPRKVRPDDYVDSGVWIEDTTAYQEKTISGGIITADGPGMIIVTSESGTSDVLDRINGLINSDIVMLIASSADGGHTITITKGTYLKLPANFTLVGPRTATFLCIGSDICWSQSLMDNRT